MSKIRVRYSKDFKQQAIAKVVNEGCYLTHTARELGIPKSVLSKWVKKTRLAPEAQAMPSPSGMVSMEDMETRLRKVEDSVETLRKVIESAYLAGVHDRFSGVAQAMG